MGRNKIVLPQGAYIIYGYDAPCNGYFAQFFDENADGFSEATEEIGFFKGVPKNAIILFLEKYNAIELAKLQTKQAFNNLILDLPC